MGDGAKSKAVFGSLRLVASAARKLRQLASFPTFAPTAAQKWIWRLKQMTDKAKLKLIEKIVGEHFEMGGCDKREALVELLNCILTIIDFRGDENDN